MGINNNAEFINGKCGKLFDTVFHQLSHELRTPLNHINGFAELLLMDKELSPANVEYVRAILSGGETLKAAVMAQLDCAEAMVTALPSAEGPDRDPACNGTDGLPLSASFGIDALDPKSSSIERSETGENFRPESVVGPLGQPMTLASLPPANTKRWVAHRKAELVAAVRGGLLTAEDVCDRYDIEPEEFASWQRGVERLGMRGLWVTRSQKNRDLFKRKQRFARKTKSQD